MAGINTKKIETPREYAEARDKAFEYARDARLLLERVEETLNTNLGEGAQSLLSDIYDAVYYHCQRERLSMRIGDYIDGV